MHQNTAPVITKINLKAKCDILIIADIILHDIINKYSNAVKQNI